MPVPTPNKGESKDKFISRCISTLTKLDPERDLKQVQAICYSQWREKGTVGVRGGDRKGEHNRPLKEEQPKMEKGKLSYQARQKLPDSAFAIPEKRKYPIQDIAHARNALARVAQHGTPEEQARVRAAVYRRYPELNPKNKKDYEDYINKDCISFVSKYYEIKKDNAINRYIEVPISGLKEDRDGERMSEKAINGMIEALQKGVPLHSNHGKVNGVQVYGWEDILGKSVDGWLDGDTLIAKFKLNKAHPKHELLWSYLKEGMPVGFSIGAKPKKSHYEEIEIKEDEI